ncbi:MAG: DNA-formamidopyrimidine glycosylase family protein [Candidatus Omnitrophota bacterium]|jgi:formamidopyrimidine-DNA glycosylase
MPELPDVENFKRYFLATSIDKKIADVSCDLKKLVKGTEFPRLRKALRGKKFSWARRRGKFLITRVSGRGEKLVFHFGMTGSLLYVKKKEKADDRHSHLIFTFKNGDRLHWKNMRKLGKVYFVKKLKKIPLLRDMGPEPLGISREDFFSLLELHKNKNVKSFLLNQRNIAGIGNIYSDEILFKARISPHNAIDALTARKKSALYNAMRRVLKRAIAIGVPWAGFGPTWLIKHRGKSKKCPRNKSHRLKREIIAGRAAIWCPGCQR